jgi:hypothetical protein
MREANAKWRAYLGENGVKGGTNASDAKRELEACFSGLTSPYFGVGGPRFENVKSGVEWIFPDSGPNSREPRFDKIGAYFTGRFNDIRNEYLAGLGSREVNSPVSWEETASAAEKLTKPEPSFPDPEMEVFRGDDPEVFTGIGG